MKHLGRKKLDAHAYRYLASKTNDVLATPIGDRAEVARAFWKSARRTVAFKTITKKLRRMASGLRRCMYCEDSAGVAIDHFWPLARYPHKAFHWKNHLYACTWCNSNKKRDQFPVSWITRKPLLIKPTLDDPLDHLLLDPDTGDFEARTPKGNMTIRVFGLNDRAELPAGRMDAFLSLQVLIKEYARLSAGGDLALAGEIERVVRRYPFSSVLAQILRLAAGPGVVRLQADFVTALQTHPEIQTWV